MENELEDLHVLSLHKTVELSTYTFESSLSIAVASLSFLFLFLNEFLKTNVFTCVLSGCNDAF